MSILPYLFLPSSHCLDPPHADFFSLPRLYSPPTFLFSFFFASTSFFWSLDCYYDARIFSSFLFVALKFIQERDYHIHHCVRLCDSLEALSFGIGSVRSPKRVERTLFEAVGPYKPGCIRKRKLLYPVLVEYDSEVSNKGVLKIQITIVYLFTTWAIK